MSTARPSAARPATPDADAAPFGADANCSWRPVYIVAIALVAWIGFLAAMAIMRALSS
ncbi:MAG: hypothetical protein CHACPFDD_03874 [Phycisphaerae bacterium]|nr:hypothetical protein [Phycisphaerae bacterium]